MKIAPELVTLTREHHISLSLSNRCINLAKTKDKVKTNALCLAISHHFETTFKSHFETEEQTLFAPLKNKSGALKNLCEKLEKEHQQLLQMAKSLKTNPELLLEFGNLLKTHTNAEDRELFRNIKYLSHEQRQAIESASNKHAKASKDFFQL